jgi:arabinan endo-1,5-alpha-L-arabinosidase
MCSRERAFNPRRPGAATSIATGLRAALALLALVGCATRVPPTRPPAPTPDWTRVVTPDTLRDLRRSEWIPVVQGPFQRVYRPAGTRYLNDHTLLRGDDGRWHLYGITHESEGDASLERSFLHASSPSLFGPWRDEADALRSEAPEEALWAPFVLPLSIGHWAMFYYGNTPDHRVLRADSGDLHAWRRTAASAPGGRDPFVLRIGGSWHLYSVGADEQRQVGQIIVSTSDDLRTWTTPAVALEDPVASFGWGNLESPVVVARGGEFYLFVTRTSEARHDYARTMVFCSRDPRRFAWAPVTELLAHAAEVIEDRGEWFVTSAGWTYQVGERWRGLSVAPLGWAPRAAVR